MMGKTGPHGEDGDKGEKVWRVLANTDTVRDSAV